MIATTLEARIPDKHVIQKDFAFLPLPVGCGMVAKFDDLQLKKKNEDPLPSLCKCCIFI